MGYGEYGGGGSITWKLDVDDETKPGKKRTSAFGRDGLDANWFEISLEYPTPDEAKRALENLKGGEMTVDGKRIVFSVRVQDNEKQIKVEWKKK